MSVVRTIRKVFAVLRDAVLVEQTADLVQQRFIERRGTAQRQRQSVAHERVTFCIRTQCLAEFAADVDPVLRRHLEEIDVRIRRFLQRTQQGPPQAESGALGGLAWTLRHLNGRYRSLPYPSCRPSMNLLCPSCPRSTNLPRRSCASCGLRRFRRGSGNHLYWCPSP